MSDKQKRPTTSGTDLGEDEIRRLLTDAGPRPEVPGDQMQAIRATARDDWRRLVASETETEVEGVGPGEQRGGWQGSVPLAIAATVLLSLILAFWWRTSAPREGSVPVATVVRGAPFAADGSELAIGTELGLATELVTGRAAVDAEPVALAWKGGPSVRIDAGSRVRVIDETTVELIAGGVYVDSRGSERALQVLTALGSVREIGTQFEVRLAEDLNGLTVRVREGEVALERGSESHSAFAGEELKWSADGKIDRQNLESWDDSWAWVVAAAPGLETRGLTLDDYLSWLARETGWTVRFHNEQLARSAADVRLQGSSIVLAPDESVHVVVPAYGFEYRLENGVLWIEP